MRYGGLRQLWQPSAETLGTIAGALASHWRAAATRPLRLFGAAPASWLERSLPREAPTSGPAGAGSSDTLPDPHLY
jgi:hypothetical protein